MSVPTKRFRNFRLTFTPDDLRQEPIVLSGCRALKATPGVTGDLARITISTLNVDLLATMTVGKTGRLAIDVTDILDPGRIYRHDYGRLEVKYCHPNAHVEAFGNLTIVLVPAGY